MLQNELGSIYQYYHIMKYYGHYSLFEVDEMFPFEREIYFNLLLDTKEREKEQG